MVHACMQNQLVYPVITIVRLLFAKQGIAAFKTVSLLRLDLYGALLTAYLCFIVVQALKM